jgi:glycosyltransferase involved in cell wall biosynthesis
MSFSPALISIIIVVKNDRAIADTLTHLFASKTDVPYEVIVVDSSEPERLADIKDAFPKARWEQYPVSARRTTPEQRNRGLEMARGDTIAFIDANCIPSPEWISAIAASIAGGKDIVCGPVLDRGDNNLVHYAPEHSEGRYVDICTTISVGIRRDVIERVGNFDTSFSFGQDIDFFWRATEAGYRIYFDPAVSIQHDWGKPREQFGRAFQYGKARAHLYKKHWRVRKSELFREPHVWVYPVFLLGLPLTFIVPWYPLLLFVPVLKNLRQNPFGLILHHMAYGCGVITGGLKSWPVPVTPEPHTVESI